MNIFSGEINGEFHVVLSGRLDTGASMQVQQDIDKAIAEVKSSEKLVIDLDHLDFISSSGLRIMLSLMKRYPNLSIINASTSVYEVFDVTGFTRMIPVSKALRRINIEGCSEIGRGGVGIVYRLSEDTIIKVFREGTDIEEVRREIELSKEAFIFGLPTAISYDIVKVDGENDTQYGLIYELLDSDTLSNILSQYPEKLEFYARKAAQLYKKLHSIEVPRDGVIPSAYLKDEIAIEKVSRYFPADTISKAHELFNLLPPGNRLLHCDLHPKNIMLQNDEMMLIDMGEVGYGNPLLDLAHTYSTMMLCVDDYKLINGITEEQSHHFFNILIDEYFKDVPAEEKEAQVELIKKIGSVRAITWLSLSDSFPEDTIQRSGQQFRRINHLP